MINGDAGKGDSYRKVDLQKYYKNWDSIFKKKSNLKIKKHKKKVALKRNP
jgi:hypothetical protein